MKVIFQTQPQALKALSTVYFSAGRPAHQAAREGSVCLSRPAATPAATEGNQCWTCAALPNLQTKPNPHHAILVKLQIWLDLPLCQSRIRRKDRCSHPVFNVKQSELRRVLPDPEAAQRNTPSASRGKATSLCRHKNLPRCSNMNPILLCFSPLPMAKSGLFVSVLANRISNIWHLTSRSNGNDERHLSSCLQFPISLRGQRLRSWYAM